jgi:hypothetical protein
MAHLQLFLMAVKHSSGADSSFERHFRDSISVYASEKLVFLVAPGAVSPVPFYEFELRELFVEATVKSGSKWWRRKSELSLANTSRKNDCNFDEMLLLLVFS